MNKIKKKKKKDKNKNNEAYLKANFKKNVHKFTFFSPSHIFGFAQNRCRFNNIHLLKVTQWFENRALFIIPRFILN